MSIDHQIMFHTPYGVKLRELKFDSLDMVRRDREVGALSLVLDGKLYDYDDFKRDCVITFERSVDGGTPYLEGKTLWFVRHRTMLISSRGPQILTVACEDTMTLLKRRLIAYFNDETQTDKSGLAGDMILAILRENLGSSAIAARDLSAFLNISANTGLGPSIEKSQFGWSELVSVLQDISNVAWQAGTYLSYDVDCTTPPGPSTSNPTFELGFSVYAGQGGQDHRSPGGNPPIIIGPDFGNLDDVTIDDDWSGENSYLYAGGEGSDDTRLIVEVSDANVIGSSPLGRIEGWFDDRDQDDSTKLTNAANGELQRRLTKTKLKGRFLDTRSIRWGRELKYKDQVTAQVIGKSFDCRMNTDHITVDRDNGETLDIRAEGEAV